MLSHASYTRYAYAAANMFAVYTLTYAICRQRCASADICYAIELLRACAERAAALRRT